MFYTRSKLVFYALFFNSSIIFSIDTVPLNHNTVLHNKKFSFDTYSRDLQKDLRLYTFQENEIIVGERKCALLNFSRSDLFYLKIKNIVSHSIINSKMFSTETKSGLIALSLISFIDGPTGSSANLTSIFNKISWTDTLQKNKYRIVFNNVSLHINFNSLRLYSFAKS